MAIGRFSDFQVHEWLSSMGPLYAALHFADPDTAGAYASEVFGGAYVRQSMTFGLPTSRVMWNTSVAAFTGLPATMLTHLALWDAVYNGNFVTSMPVPGLTTDPRSGIRVLPGGRYDVGVEQVALSFP